MQDIAIEKLGLSVRTCNCLKRSRVFFLSQVMLLKIEDMKQIRNMGVKCIEEILALQKKISEDMGDDVEFIEALAEEKESISGEILLIHKSFPQILGKQIPEIVFTGKYGTMEADIPVVDSGLSVRTTNALLASGYDSIKKVALEKLETVELIRNMGARSLNELVSFISSKADITMEDEPANQVVENIFYMFRKFIEENGNGFEISVISKPIKTNIQKNKKNYVNKIVDYDYFRSTEFINDILMQNNIIHSISQYLLSIIQKKRKWIDLSTLELVLPKLFVEIKLFEASMDLLISDRSIEKKDRLVRIRLPYIDEWIGTLKEKPKAAVTLRLSNKTLEECGVELGITRERVRQIVARAVRNKPLLREDDNAYWYTEYLLDKEAMSIIFEENEKTFDYLSVVYNHGTKDIAEMNDDPQLTKDIYVNLQKYLNRNSIVIAGEYVPCRRDLLCRKLAKHLCSESDMSFDDFYGCYLKLLSDNGLNDNEKLLFPSERAFEARLENSTYILMKYGRTFRYYPIREYDVTELIQELHFEQFVDVEISTLKLFVEYPEVMQEFGIIDEYELHNLLKKTQSIWNPDNSIDVVFTRMPFMVFGNADRGKQTERLLFQVAPVTMDEYCEFYEMEYGVLARTAMANMTPFISNYYHEGLYSINQPLLDEHEKTFMTSYLTKDFYFVEDIKEAFLNHFTDSDVERINPRTLKELGFRVFTNYVIRSTYQSADEYFTEVYMENDLLDLTQQDSRMIYVQSANQALDKLRLSYELLEYEDKKYIKFTHLISVAQNMTKDDIYKYVDAAISYSGNEEFFTVKKLINDGFDDEVHHIGLGEWFASGLLKNSKKVRFVKSGSNVIFYKGDSQFTTVDFIRYILKTKRKMDIDDFIEYVSEEYGVKLLREKITWLIKNSDMYYDSIMEKLYLTKEYYYDEI